MASQVVTATLQAPGFLGLNIQESAVNLSAGYALEAFNCVVDQKGRIGSRRGWTTINSNSVSGDVGHITEFIDHTDTSTTFCCANNKIYKVNASAYTELTYGGGGTAPTITGNNWQSASIGNRLYFFQLNHTALVYDPAVSTTTYRRITEASGYVATAPEANCVISAYGRLWAANTVTDKDTLCFSDLLNGNVWNTGTAGTLDISTVWVGGSDSIQAIAAFNGFLFIFGKRQILIYKGAEDPSTMSLQDIVKGVGCIARDSVATTGSDIIFLSEVGVMSLMRLIQEKSAPLRDISANVRDDLVGNLQNETTANIKAVYYPRDAFYLLTFPTTGYTYCFDTRRPLENGAARVTIWNQISPKSYLARSDNTLLIGKTNHVGVYQGYQDNGSMYRMTYKTNHFDLDKPTNIKILKKLGWVIIGGTNQNISILYGFNYSETLVGESIQLPSEGISEYNIAEYGIGEYSDGVVLEDVYVNAGGSGETIQVGLEADINGTFMSIQRVDLYCKLGKIYY